MRRTFPSPKAFPLSHLARRAFPLSHFDYNYTYSDENPTIKHLDKPQFGELQISIKNSRRYMNCAPHHPLARRAFPLSHLAARRYPSATFLTFSHFFDHILFFYILG